MKNFEESVKNILVPGMVFEELGIRYFGPVDGHDLAGLIRTIRNLLTFRGPCLLHVLTKKAKGLDFGKDEPPASYHSYGPYCYEKKTESSYGIEPKGGGKGKLSYTKAFSNSILKLAAQDEKVVAITAAMPEGTGLTEFQKRFPDRFFDVGIAEGHGITFAGALSRGGMKPVCAIYSTFLQRAYDHLIHDVSLQDANVTICMDRSGLCGPDGPSHHGMFDIAYLRAIPNSVVCSPRDEAEMLRMMDLGLEYPGVFGIRYPKDDVAHDAGNVPLAFGIGEGEIIREGKDLAFLVMGNMVDHAIQVAAILKEKEGIDAGIFNMRFAKPLDRKLLAHALSNYEMVATLEEHVRTGGFSAAILESQEHQQNPATRIIPFSFPDKFLEHGSRNFLFDKYGMSPVKIADHLLETLKAARLIS